MSIIEFLEFITDDSLYVIYGLLALVVGLSILVFIRGGRESTEISGLDSQNVEALKEAMKAAASQIPAPSASGISHASPEADAELANEVTRLNDQLSSKNTEIEALQAQLEEARAAGGGGESAAGGDSELQAQVEELQARLKEYEIIEEDIADLSHYKEKSEQLEREVADLQQQLSTQAAAPAPVAEPAPPVAEPEPEPAPAPEPVAEEPVQAAVDDNIMAEFAAAVEEDDEPEPVPAEPAVAEAEPAVEPAVDDDIMAEFAAAVEDGGAPVPERESELPAAELEGATDNLLDEISEEEPGEDPQAMADAAIAAALAEAEDEPAPEPVAEAQPEAVAEPAGDAGAEEVVAAAEEEGDDEADAAFDLDKMMEEASGLEVGEEEVNAAEAIGTELDTDKLLAEANDIGSNDTEDLMEKFEEKVSDGS